jgi:ElaB/YqjD/DUF883 family membrane-anchored ribosome-binding protein
MGNNLEEEIRFLNKRLDQLSKIIEKKVSDTSDSYANTIQDTAAVLGKKLRSCCDEWLSNSEEAISQLKCSAEEGKKRLCEGTSKIKEEVGNNPFISLGISALVGFVFAFLFSRRK